MRCVLSVPVSYTHLDVYKRQGSDGVGETVVTAVAAGLWEADCDHKWLSESGSEQVGGWRVFEPACRCV